MTGIGHRRLIFVHSGTRARDTSLSARDMLSDVPERRFGLMQKKAIADIEGRMIFARSACRQGKDQVKGRHGHPRR